MPKNAWTHAVPVLSSGALLGSCVLSFFPSVAAAPVSAGGVAVSSIILAYWMTQASERKRFQEEKKEIGRVAIRRAQNLSDDLRDFSQHIKFTELPKGTIEFWLESKARDALTSLDDIRDMAGMTGEDSVIAQREKQAKAESSAENVVVSCLKCGTNNELYLSSVPNSTRMFACQNCEYRQNVHRLPDGNYKVSDPNKNLETLKPISCPNCSNQIPLPRVKNTHLPVKRICMSCATPIEYIPIEDKIRTLEIPEQKASVNSVPDTYHCKCGKIFEPNVTNDREGRAFFACFNCLRAIYLETPEV